MMNPFFQQMQMMGQNPFATPGGGMPPMQNNAPQIPMKNAQPSGAVPQPGLPPQQDQSGLFGSMMKNPDMMGKMMGMFGGDKGGQQALPAGTSALPVAPGQYESSQALENATGKLYASPYQAQQSQGFFGSLFGGGGGGAGAGGALPAAGAAASAAPAISGLSAAGMSFPGIAGASGLAGAGASAMSLADFLPFLFL